jgi:hypothetical protein
MVNAEQNSGGPSKRRVQLIFATAEIARHDRAKAIIIFVFLLLVFRQMMAAPIRAYLPLLWYLPDVLAAVALLAAIYISWKRKITTLMIAFAFLLLFFVLSVLQNTLESVLLSMRQIVYLAIAVIAGYVGQQGREKARRWVIAFSIICIAGVAYDYFFVVPWRGMLFEGVLNTKAVSREWWDLNGVRRLAGFGLASSDTSIVIACGMIVLAAIPAKNARYLFFVLVGPAIWAVLATTQKATCGSFFLVGGAMLICTMSSPYAGLRRATSTLQTMTLAAIIATMLVPIAFFQFSLKSVGVAAPTLNQRMGEVWPTVITYLVNSPQTLFGYGFGSAGDTSSIPQFLLVDNMFLFTTITVGLIAALFAFLLVFLAVLSLKSQDAETLGGLGIITLLAINGITANVVAAGGIGSLFLGYAIGIVTRPKPKMVRRRLNET